MNHPYEADRKPPMLSSALDRFGKVMAGFSLAVYGDVARALEDIRRLQS